MAKTPKKRIIDDVTKIDAGFLQSVYGGDTTAVSGSTERDGHIHDGGSNWGSVQKVDLTNHTTGRLVLQDQFSVLKTIGLPSAAASTLGNSVVWYFTIPTDIDISKSAYFAFNWMGDSTDGANNILSVLPQTTVYRITWQWYVPGYAMLSPAIIYDSQPPANQSGSNINANTLTRGRLPNFTVNTAPFQLLVNDSFVGKPNYVQLTGLNQAQNSVIVGVQVEVLSTGFSNGVVFFNGNFSYLSKTMGGSNISISSI